MEGISKERIQDIFASLYWQSHDLESLLNKLLSECQELNPWMPIDENTPKDRDLLGYIREEYEGDKTVIHWGASLNCWVDDCGNPIEPGPTHWQELPEDPK